MQLTHLHHKMLEENNYFTGRFQSTGSDFNKTYKSKKKLHDEEDSEDSIDMEK